MDLRKAKEEVQSLKADEQYSKMMLDRKESSKGLTQDLTFIH